MLFTIDIGGTFIKYGLMDADYQLVHTDKIPTPPTIEEFWQGLEEIIAPVRKKSRGSPFHALVRSKRVLALFFRGGLIPYLRGIPLASRLEQTFQVPVTVLNDGEAAGLAEARLGNLKDCPCGATLVLGTGSWPCSSF